MTSPPSIEIETSDSNADSESEFEVESGLFGLFSEEDLSQLSETELLMRARQGDDDAFSELQQRLEPPIYRYVRRLTGAANIEDDILQDVFLALYLNLNRIDPPEKLRPYVYRMARNRCYDEFRRWDRREMVSLDNEPTQLHVSFTAHMDQPKPDDITHWMLLLIDVQEAMEELPNSQREALLLYSEAQLSYAEIAEVLDVSLGTVKSRIYHAKKKLRQLLPPETIAAIENS